MESQQSPINNYPSSWKKPDEVIRMMRKRKKALDIRLKQEKSPNNTKQIEKKTNSHQSLRYNPFKKKIVSHTQTNKPITELEESCDDSTLFQLFNPQFNTPSQSSNTILDISQFFKTLEKEKEPIKKEEIIWLTKLPVDWSLKTKLRIMSSVNFKWNCTTLKTTEEASGTTGFVRCLNSDDKIRLDTTASAELHQRCLYWIHPSMSWLKLFPRFVQRTSAGKSFCAKDAKIQKQLHTDWCDSFRSLWQLLRSRQCAYFFLCADSFTALFRCSGIAGFSEINAMITPTTTGFRNALTEEGIVFTRPLSKSHHSPADSGIGTDSECSWQSQDIKSQNSQIVKESNGAKSDDDEVSSWLNSVGLEEKNVLTGNNLIRKLSQRKKRNEDSRPESMIYVEGMDVHSLYNFLLNSNNFCISNNGPLAGIPPTLISSVAFQGATLRPLKVKHEIVQQGRNKFNSIELSGPILPHISHSLVKLMMRDNSEISSYKIYMSTLEPTSPFSKLTDLQGSYSEFAKQNLVDCGLHQDLIDILCATGNGQVINEITSKDGVFKCN